MNGQLLGGRYRLDHEIGAGGMGRVWRARDVRLDREVAVKTVDLSRVSDPSLAGRFEREIVLTARLTSPYTVTVFDGGVDGGTAFLVMELLGGESLAQAIERRGPLDVAQTVEVARQVTLGLAAAHSVGLVHRDIKPANVMITDGKVKLLDFGIAQLTGNADAQLTATAMTIGTAAYMSPEQAAGLRVDSATDLYALGCLIMTMLTGRPPFDGEQAVVVASHQINSEPPRLRDRRGDVPPVLDDLVVALLAKNPLSRPDTATVLRELERLQANPQASRIRYATPTTPPQPATRPYTQPASANPAPANPAQANPAAARFAALAGLSNPGGAWIAGVLVSLMAAILVSGLAISLTGAAIAQVNKAFPGPSATPSKKTTSAKPTPSRTTTTPTKSPSSSGPSGELTAAMQGVDFALSLMPDSESKTDLQEQWTTTKAQISASQNPKSSLNKFEAAVKKSSLEVWQQQAVLAATGQVKSRL